MSKASQTNPGAPSAPEHSLSSTAEAPYSIYSKKEKWFLVILIAGSGLFSPLTGSIYFPAIPVIADAFGKSTELINLTITMYMVFQGIAPMFFGALADYVGRRLIYMSCLAILSLSCVGLALCPTNAYWLLMVLRCLQATGSTSTIALGAGVIGDIAEPFERGGFMGAYVVGPVIGPAIAPVIGGVLLASLGWRSIFWFLVIAAGVACIIVLLILPETLRAIVGNGSILPPPLLRPIFPVVAGYKKGAPTAQDLKTKSTKKKFRNPLILLLNPDIPLLLFFNGTVSSIYFGVTVSISSLFVKLYPFLTQIEMGLCFLCVGGGMMIGSLISGKILDWEYHRVSRAYYLQKSEGPNGGHVEGLDLKVAREDPDFPIEYARLRATPYYMVFFISSVIGYGWCIQEVTHISVPLILLFIIGLSGIFFLNATQTLTVDLVPKQSSSVSACNNLFRGTLGAILVSVIDLLLKALTPGWTYVLLGGVCAMLTPLVWVVIKIGPGCRKRRREKETKEIEETNGRAIELEK